MIFSIVLGNIDDYVKGFVQESFQSISDYMMPAIYAAFVLYVIFQGLKYLIHPQQGFDFLDFSVKMAKIAFIVFLVGSWDTFAFLFYDTFFDVSEKIGSIATGSEQGAAETLDGIFMAQMLAAFAKFLLAYLILPGASVLGTGWDAIQIINFPLVVLGMGDFYVGVLFFGTALCMLVATKIGIAIVIILAPIFLPLYMFDQTKGMADSWLRTSLGLFLTQPLVVITLNFVAGFIQAQSWVSFQVNNPILQAFTQFATMINPISDIQILIVEIAAMYFLQGIPGLAAGLVGGSAVYAGGEMSSQARNYAEIGLTGHSFAGFAQKAGMTRADHGHGSDDEKGLASAAAARGGPPR